MPTVNILVVSPSSPMGDLTWDELSDIIFIVRHGFVPFKVIYIFKTTVDVIGQFGSLEKVVERLSLGS